MGSERGSKDCKLGIRVLRAGRWETLAGASWYMHTHTHRHTNKPKCVHRSIHMYIYSMNNEHWNTQVRAEMQTHTQCKTLATCKQSLHQSLYERSKSTLTAVPFHAIPQPSHTIPTSHLHIKQGSHSHTLTNDSWMLLTLSYYNCTSDLCSSSCLCEGDKKGLSNSSLISTGQGLVLLWTGCLTVGVSTIFRVLAQQYWAVVEPNVFHSRATPAKSGG